MSSIFLPVFALLAVLLLFFADFASLMNLITFNGEVIYACGFLIVFYIIWLEGFQSLDSFSPTFSFSNLAFFWLHYKKIEVILFKLLLLKVRVISALLNIFLLSSLSLKLLSFLKTNNFIFKLSVNSLNKIRSKFKSLPLQ